MVSVIIPTYNRENTILESINSVLNQTYTDFELLIIDDGSTDATKNVIDSIKDTRVRYIYQENAGACAARNHGIDEAKGDLIAFQDSDDLWYTDKLEKQVNVINDTEADLVFCKLVRTDKSGNVFIMPEGMEQGFLDEEASLFNIGTQSLLARSDIFKECRFDDRFPRFQDLELLLRIAEKYKIYCMGEGLVDYRVGNDSISNNSKKLIRAIELLIRNDYNLIIKRPIMLDEIFQILYNVESELESAKESYDIISNSTCWKITKPLRTFMDCIKQISKKQDDDD